MNILLIFCWVYGAMLAHALWEGEVEGRRAWDRGKLGWKIDLGFVKLTEYHFWLFFVIVHLRSYKPPAFVIKANLFL